MRYLRSGTFTLLRRSPPGRHRQPANRSLPSEEAYYYRFRFALESVCLHCGAGPHARYFCFPSFLFFIFVFFFALLSSPLDLRFFSRRSALPFSNDGWRDRLPSTQPSLLDDAPEKTQQTSYIPASCLAPYPGASSSPAEYPRVGHLGLLGGNPSRTSRVARKPSMTAPAPAPM